MFWGLNRKTPKVEKVKGCPFPVNVLLDEVPLRWFIEQGASPAHIIAILRPLLMTEEDVPRSSVSVFAAWNLLDELIARDWIDGPIHPYSPPPSVLQEDEPQFTDVWNELWGHPVEPNEGTSPKEK